jgi:hypothetical protein
MIRFFTSKPTAEKPSRVFVLLSELNPINTKTPALVQFYSPGDDVIIEVLATDWALFIEQGKMIPHTPKTQNQTRL